MRIGRTMAVLILTCLFVGGGLVGVFEYLLVKNAYIMPLWIHVELRGGQFIIIFFSIFMWIKTYIELKREERKKL